MKKLSLKLILLITFLSIAGLSSAALWANIAGGVGALVMIVLCHLDNLDFCRKMDRIMAGEKNIEL